MDLLFTTRRVQFDDQYSSCVAAYGTWRIFSITYFGMTYCTISPAAFLLDSVRANDSNAPSTAHPLIDHTPRFAFPILCIVDAFRLISVYHWLWVVQSSYIPLWFYAPEFPECRRLNDDLTKSYWTHQKLEVHTVVEGFSILYIRGTREIVDDIQR